MGKEIRKFFTFISMLGLLASCTGSGTLEARNDNTSMATESIRTFIDHDELARRYENRANKLLAMAVEREKRLQHDEDKNDARERHGQDSRSHDAALGQNTGWKQRELPPQLIFTTEWRRELRTVITSLWARYIDLHCPRSSAGRAAWRQS